MLFLLKFKNMIAESLKLLLMFALICTPGGFMIRLLAKKNLIGKDNPVGKENLINLGTKLMLFSSIVFVVATIYILLKK